MTKGVAAAVALILLSIIIIIDFVTPPYVLLYGFYIFPIAIAASYSYDVIVYIVLLSASAVNIDMMALIIPPGVPAWAAAISYGAVLVFVWGFGYLAIRVRSAYGQVAENTARLRDANRALARRETEFRSLAENTPDLIARFDLDGTLTYANAKLADAVGTDAARLVGRPVDAIDAARYAALGAGVRQVGQSGASLDIEQNVPGPDGSSHIYLIRLVAEPGPDGRGAGVLGVGRDVTETRRKEEQIRLAAAVFDNSSEGVMVTDIDDVILSVNPAFSEITGYDAGEAVGATPRILRSDRHDADFYRAMFETLARTKCWRGEIWNRRKDGEAYLQWTTINQIDGPDGKPDRYVAVFHDVTELRQQDERVAYLACHDALTGLPNRVLLTERLSHAIARLKREGGALSVTFFDLDRFKAVNDTFGHDIGDLLLQEVAGRMKERLRETDTIARMGGDEFVVLMEDLTDPAVCTDRIGQVVADLARPMQLGGHTVEVGVSAGVAFCPGDGTDADALMKRDDMAMYAAKAAGRSTWRRFDSDDMGEPGRTPGLGGDLRRAIADGVIELHYQPKVALGDCQVNRVEALARWRHPRHGLLTADAFVPLAVERGLMVDLGLHVIEEVCRHLAAWRKAGRTFRVAINVSAPELGTGTLPERLAEAAARHGVSPADLEVELSEQTVARDPEGTTQVIERLRKLGTTVAIDGFGAGHSNLFCLGMLPIDTVKIDRWLVGEAQRSDKVAQIIRGVVALARDLGLTVVAEGVETEAQLDLIRSLCGDGLGQGLYFSPPLPADELLAWMDARKAADRQI